MQLRMESGERDRRASARYDLSKVRIESPIDGIVTRRNIEEGETVVIGTMNNAGTVLLTIADMSVIQAEVEVDETDIPNVSSASRRRSRSTRCPARRSPARSPRSATARSRRPPAHRRTQATNFKVVVTLDEEIPEVRPGLHLHGGNHDGDSRQRGHGADPGDDRARDDPRREGQDRPSDRTPRRASVGATPAAAAARPSSKPGQTRKELEGVFVGAGQQGGVHADQDGHRRAKSISRCCRGSRKAIRSSPDRSLRSAHSRTARR